MRVVRVPTGIARFQRARSQQRGRDRGFLSIWSPEMGAGFDRHLVKPVDHCAPQDEGARARCPASGAGRRSPRLRAWRARTRASRPSLAPGAPRHRADSPGSWTGTVESPLAKPLRHPRGSRRASPPSRAAKAPARRTGGPGPAGRARPAPGGSAESACHEGSIEAWRSGERVSTMGVLAGSGRGRQSSPPARGTAWWADHVNRRLYPAEVGSHEPVRRNARRSRATQASAADPQAGDGRFVRRS